MFSPSLTKHSLGTGDIKNHIIIRRIEHVKALRIYLVTVGFKASPGEDYEFEVQEENRGTTTDELKMEIARQLASKTVA